MSTTYKIEGMTCEGCVASLTRAIKAVAEDAAVTIDLGANTLQVVGLDEAAVVQAVDDAGFEVSGQV